MQRLLKKILRAMAVRLIARYRPKVVAVAGSVGKTSTTRAVAAAIGRSFRTRASSKNHNNEIGVPLTILGEKASGGRSPFAWAAILLRGAWSAWGPARPYPEALVLEMATDHPGDLDYLTGIARPDVAVVTAISEEHTEFLGDLDGVAQEEGSVVAALSASGTAVLNVDDSRVAAMAARAKGRVLTFGFGQDADVRGGRDVTERAMHTFFTRFDLHLGGRAMNVTLSGALGRGNVYAALAAAAVADALGVDPELVPFGLAEYQPPPGRLRALPGIKGLTLIDDTYNSSPRAADLALETLSVLEPGEGGRRYAVLGDMLELGALAEEAHRKIGEIAASRSIEFLIGVGPLSSETCRAAIAAGMPEERVFHFHQALEASHFLQERLRSGDVILIKGSQGMRMEKAVKGLMAEPERAQELLVRQTRDWLDAPGA